MKTHNLNFDMDHVDQSTTVTFEIKNSHQILMSKIGLPCPYLFRWGYSFECWDMAEEGGQRQRQVGFGGVLVGRWMWSGGDVFETAEERSCHFCHSFFFFLFVFGWFRALCKIACQEPDTRVRHRLGRFPKIMHHVPSSILIETCPSPSPIPLSSSPISLRQSSEMTSHNHIIQKKGELSRKETY